MVIFLVILGALVGLVVARRRRKKVLSGLVATRPVYSVEPPTRRMSARKHEAL